jgi:hypothetical protein
MLYILLFLEVFVVVREEGQTKRTCDRGSIAVEGRSGGGDVEAFGRFPILLGGPRLSLTGDFFALFWPSSARETTVSKNTPKYM